MDFSPESPQLAHDVYGVAGGINPNASQTRVIAGALALNHLVALTLDAFLGVILKGWGGYFAAFFCLAQRALTAATILARPSGDILRFFATGADVALGLPGLRFAVVPVNRSLACCRRAISTSSSASIFLISIY
jgi:hypothetical protein